MTIPRVLLAAAILVLGFMIWGLHKDAYGINQAVLAQSSEMKTHITEVGDKLIGVAAKPPVTITKTRTVTKYVKQPGLKARIHKRRVPPVRFTTYQDPNHSEFDGLYMFMPPMPPTYSTPLQP